MSTSVSFTGSGFSLQSVTPMTPGKLRVRFSQDPRQSNPAAGNDGLNPNNYLITGPGTATVSSVATVVGDPQSLDLFLAAPLAAGTWNLAVANITTPGNTALSAPTSLPFVITDQANVTELTAGTEPDDPARVIRKHLHPAMAGPNWDAVIEGLSQGDDINWDNARAAFDQLFLASATGRYLDRLAANNGITRPESVGIADDLFRLLTTRLTNNKITHQALREILEVFYGQDSLRAYAETDLEEPFALREGQVLTWRLDEDQDVSYEVQDGHYAITGRAKALEVAAALTKAMRDAGSGGFAAAVSHPETGGQRVRIYSPSLGLKSYVRVTGGTGQPHLRFPTYLETYTGTVTTGSGYTWVVTVPEQNVTRLSLTTSGQPAVDISPVEEGDYLVVGPGIAIPAGTYAVRSVGFSWSGANLTQVVELSQEVGYTGSYLQAANDDFRYFRPTRRSILAGSRTVVVAQTRPGIVDIQIPVTTQAVNRTVGTGAYGRDNGLQDVKRYVRDGQGNLRVFPESPFAVPPPVGSGVFIAGAKPAAIRPWVSLGVPGTHPAVATADGSYGTLWCGTQTPPSAQNQETEGIRLQNGDFLIAGGWRFVATVQTLSATAQRLRPVGTAAITDSSEAEGATRRTYQWISTTAMNAARWRHGISLLNDGRVLVTGGMDLAAAHIGSTELYTPGTDTWVTQPALATARAFHRQVTLLDGRVIVIGGSTAPGPGSNATATTEVFAPATLTWAAGGTMLEGRQGHRALRLPDGRVFVTGGTGKYPVTSPTLLCTTEFYDPGTDTWTAGPRMSQLRAYHEMVALPDGRVMVIGGLGRVASYPDLGLALLNTTEIWEPNTNRWTPGPALPVTGTQVQGTVQYNGKVYLVTLAGLEYLDLQQMTWRPHWLLNTASRDRLWDVGGGLGLATGGSDGSNAYTTTDLLVLGSDTLSGGGINGIHEVTASDGVSFTVRTPEQPGYASNTGDVLIGGTVFDATTQRYIPGIFNRYTVSSGTRASNVTTLTLFGGNTTTGLAVGQRVYVNLNGTPGFTPGFQTLTALTSTTVSYADPGGASGPTALTGNVSIDSNPDASFIFAAAEARPTGDPGPYIYDPDDGLALTAVETDLTSALQLSHHYDRLQVGSAAGFPDAPGYLVLDFGTAQQSQPIRYLEKVGPNLLLLDFGYAMTHDYPVGTTVTLLASRGAFVPDADEASNFWVTGSTAGRVAAETTARAAAAAGIALDFNVIYPGDRGLGGEGYPTEGDGKLSDITEVFGGDDLDEEA